MGRELSRISEKLKKRAKYIVNSSISSFLRHMLTHMKFYYLSIVVPLGLEPRLFWTKTRRVASYTMGQLGRQI